MHTLQQSGELFFLRCLLPWHQLPQGSNGWLSIEIEGICITQLVISLVSWHSFDSESEMRIILVSLVRPYGNKYCRWNGILPQKVKLAGVYQTTLLHAKNGICTSTSFLTRRESSYISLFCVLNHTYIYITGGGSIVYCCLPILVFALQKAMTSILEKKHTIILNGFN